MIEVAMAENTMIEVTLVEVATVEVAMVEVAMVDVALVDVAMVGVAVVGNAIVEAAMADVAMIGLKSVTKIPTLARVDIGVEHTLPYTMVRSCPIFRTCCRVVYYHGGPYAVSYTHLTLPTKA